MKLDLAALEAEAAAESEDREPFEVTARDGRTIRLPHSDEMTLRQVQDFDESKPQDALRVLLGDEACEEFMDTPMPVLNKIISEWLPWSGLGTMGEGIASPPSLTGSAGRSKRTSRGTTRATA